MIFFALNILRLLHAFEGRSKPVVLVSNEKQLPKEMVVKSFSTASPTISTGEQTQYQQSNFDYDNSDMRVRRAFLWIKVDETIRKKAAGGARNSTKHQKFKGNRRHRNFFRLWVFHIAETNPVRLISN